MKKIKDDSGGKKVSTDDIKKLKQEKDAAQTELIQKERELSTLKEESDQLQEKHEKELVKLQESIMQDRERIKKEISEEILNNGPDRKKVKELEKELKDKEVAQREIDKRWHCIRSFLWFRDHGSSCTKI